MAMLLINSQVSLNDGPVPGALRDPSCGSLGVIYDFYYAVKMREFLQWRATSRGCTRRYRELRAPLRVAAWPRDYHGLSDEDLAASMTTCTR